jgi:calcium-dependent protein kinase
MIAYEETIASMLESQRVAMRTDAVRNSFEKLDHDADGCISVQDLHQVRAGGGGDCNRVTYA